MTAYSDFLASVPLFSGLTSENIKNILKEIGAYTVCYDKDAYIRNAGDPADFIGIVLEGTIQILQDDYYGNRNIIASFSKGTLFAEAFACSGTPCLPVDVISSSDTIILFINWNKIMSSNSSATEKRHILIRNMLTIVARKNLLLNQKLQYTFRRTTGEKIMAYLNDQAKLHHSPEFIIPFNRQELADYLGVERSAMSAEISKLVKKGYIVTNRSYFRLIKVTP